VLLVVIFLPKFDPVTKEPLFSDRLFKWRFDSSLALASRVYPEVKFESSIQDFLESDATLKIASDPRFQELTLLQQKLVVGEAVRTSIEDWQKYLGKVIAPAQPLKDFIFDIMKKNH